MDPSLDVDIPGFQAAVDDLKSDSAAAGPWIVPADEKHFDGAIFAMGLASALLAAFLAGFSEGATEQAKALGKALGEGVGGWLARRIKNLVSGKADAADHESAAVGDLAKLAPKAPRNAVSAKALDDAEALIATELAHHMPKQRAQKLAHSARAKAEARILPHAP